VKRALCSIGAGPHEALLDISEPTFRAYADRHRYELIVSREADPGRPAPWAKVPMLREAVDAFDLVLWIDADAVIVDGSRDIADELERELGLVAHAHGGQRVPNTGVMVLRTGEFARSLLDEVWGATGRIHHPWWENAALLEALGYRLPGGLEPGLRGRLLRLAGRRELAQVRPSPYLEQTQFLSNVWNSTYLDPAENARIVHCVGVPVEQRARDMTAAARVVKW
jgi:galactosyl transferase GMA12/MNN10 family